MAEKSLSEQVRDIVMYVLYRDDELPARGRAPVEAVLVHGVVNRFGFHPNRLMEKKPEIKAILEQMPDEFQAAKGGGMSFLALCMTKTGEHWAEHRTMDELVCLALGTGMASFPMSRDLWATLPGSVPYVTFDTTK